MSIDTSIYNNIKLFDQNDPIDVQTNAARLSSIGLRNAQEAKQMKDSDQKKKLMEIGSTYDSVMSLPEDKREGAWNQGLKKLVDSGHLAPNEAMPYSPETAAMIGHQLNNTPEYLAIKKAQYELTSAKNDPMDRELARSKTRAEIAKLNAEAKSKLGDLLPPTKESKLASLNSSDKQRYDNVVMANDAINEMGSALNSNVPRYSPFGDNNYTAALSRFEEAVGRMQSGGAINKDEGERFRALARSALDNPKMQRQKLDELKQIMRSRYKTLGFDPQGEGSFAYLKWDKKGNKTGSIIKDASADSAMPDFHNMSEAELTKYIGGN